MSYTFPSTRTPGNGIGMYGFAEFKSILQQLPGRVQQNVCRTAVFRAAQKVRDDAKNLLQANGNVRSDEKLLDSIKARRARNKLNQETGEMEAAAKIYSKVRYAHLIELGHTVHTTSGKWAEKGISHVPASPFLVPALEAARPYLLELIKQNLKFELEKAWSKHGLGRIPEPQLDEEE